MAFILRQIDEDAKLTDEIALEAIETVVSPEQIETVIESCGVREQRRRQLPADVTIWLCIAMNLFAKDALGRVLKKMLKGLRYVWPDDGFVQAGKSAISAARSRIGAAPLRELFHLVCQPLATENTRGAFLFGLRVLAMDGTREDLQDTPENDLAFGRPRGGRGDGAFPQVKCVYLAECGTHAILDCELGPCHMSEHEVSRTLLRKVGAGDLLTWDCGLHSFALAQATRDRRAHFLGRVPANVKLEPWYVLPDGSYLAWIAPSDYHQRRAGARLLVRVIEYTVDDPALPGYGEVSRLITSLLNYQLFPALVLAAEYHQRWEIEITIDEIDTHQRLAQQPLRSKTPEGVRQEIYGLLIAHYAVRAIMHDAALLADVDPDRLSFTHSLSLICEAVPEFQQTAPEQLPRLYQRLLRDIARELLPQRDHRSNPRVVKRKMSKFPKKRPHHRHAPQPCRPFRESVVVLK